MCAGPSLQMGVVGQSQPSVGREGTNRVHWQVTKKPMPTKTIVLADVSLPFDVRGHGHCRLYCPCRLINIPYRVERDKMTIRSEVGTAIVHHPCPGSGGISCRGIIQSDLICLAILEALCRNLVDEFNSAVRCYCYDRGLMN